MRLLLVYILFGIGTLLSAFSPVFAAAFYTWNNIFRPLDFSYMGEAFGAATYVTICLASSIFLHFFRGHFRFRFNLGTLSIFIFLCWVGISTFMSPLRPVAWDGMILVLKYLAPLILISMAFRTFREVEIFTWTMALSVGIWGAQAGLHGIIRGAGVTDMGIPGAQMSDRNDFIVGVLIAIPLMVYMCRYYDGFGSKFVKPGLVLLTILTVVAVPISLSRGGMLGLACMIIFVATLSRKRFRNLFLIALFVPIVYFALPDFVFERLQTVNIGTDQTEGSAAARLGNMRAGIAMTADYPITGVGPYAFLSFVELYATEKLEPHSIWIKASAELGAFGLLLYLTILGVLNWNLFGIYRKQFQNNRKAAHLAIAFLSSFIGFNAAATFSNKLYSEYQWTLVAISGALLGLANAPKSKRPAKEKP